MNVLYKQLIVISVLIIVLFGCGEGNKSSSEKSTKDLTESTISPKKESSDKQETIIKENVYLYFSDVNLMSIKKIQREVQVSKKDDLPKVTVEEWLEGPGANYKDLANVVPPGVVVEYVKEVDGVAHISFSKEIKNANLGSSGELALVEQLSMILQQFGYSKTQILIEGSIVETALGHMDTSKPILAKDPSAYELIK
ncbi:MAG: Lipoprotein LpqB, GerMN domain [Bacillales bacterium]|jgi:spore germination protein GerM|nr:Lipoprotein LpqB, GerMN domain [Bacillales bacterium]